MVTSSAEELADFQLAQRLQEEERAGQHGGTAPAPYDRPPSPRHTTDPEPRHTDVDHYEAPVSRPDRRDEFLQRLEAVRILYSNAFIIAETGPAVTHYNQLLEEAKRLYSTNASIQAIQPVSTNSIGIQAIKTFAAAIQQVGR